MIFSTYSDGPKQFGPEPYELLSELIVDNILSWIEEEFSSLEEVFTIARDNFAMV